MTIDAYLKSPPKPSVRNGRISAARSAPPALRLKVLQRLREIPQILTTVEEQCGRQVRIGGQWRCDFSSLNYLGFDLEPEVMAAVCEAIKRWGVHPSWTRAVASPAIYLELERELAETVGAPDTLVFPSVSLLHLGVLPVLAGPQGVILKDVAAHQSILEACMRAEAEGTEVVEFRRNDVDEVEHRLASYAPDRPKIIATDGVFSMGGPNAPLAEYSRLAKQYNATVYVDDAHGFGIIGANPDSTMPYGYGGGGIVRHLGLDYGPDRIVYVAGLSKAFSSYGAFVTCDDADIKARFQTSDPFVHSGPTTVASLASALTGLRLNRRDGDERRQRIFRLTRRVIREAERLGFEIDNDHGFPILGIVIGRWEGLVDACQTLWEHNILITPATFPAVPVNRNLLRFSITAANTDREVDEAIDALRAVAAKRRPQEIMADSWKRLEATEPGKPWASVGMRA